VPHVRDLPTHEERVAFTEDARREARFKHAEARVRKIVDGAPKLSDAQRSRLASLLAPGGDAT